MSEEKKKEEERVIDLRMRKPACLIFVRHKCNDMECQKDVMERMIKVCTLLGMEKYDEVVIDEHIYENLKAKGIPELLLHDFQSEQKPLSAFNEYYVVKYEDGGTKAVLMLKDRKPEPPLPKVSAPEVMYG